MAQPNKGERVYVPTRMPKAIAEKFKAEAKDAGMSYSDYLCDILADRYQLPFERVVPKSRRNAQGQQALPIETEQEGSLVRAS